MERSLGVDQVDKSRTPSGLFFLIHRATGALRREAASTKSGHGGSSGVDRRRSTVRIDGPRKDSDSDSANYIVTAWFHMATPEHPPG